MSHLFSTQSSQPSRNFFDACCYDAAFAEFMRWPAPSATQGRTAVQCSTCFSRVADRRPCVTICPGQGGRELGLTRGESASTPNPGLDATSPQNQAARQRDAGKPAFAGSGERELRFLPFFGCFTPSNRTFYQTRRQDFGIWKMNRAAQFHREQMPAEGTVPVQNQADALGWWKMRWSVRLQQSQDSKWDSV